MPKAKKALDNKAFAPLEADSINIIQPMQNDGDKYVRLKILVNEMSAWIEECVDHGSLTWDLEQEAEALCFKARQFK